MITILIGEPDDTERDAELAEATRGITEAEEFLRVYASDTQIQEVGRGITSIVDRNFMQSAGRFASGHIVPRKQHIQEFAPGVYYLN